MSRIRTMPEITEEGTRALVRALGYPDAVRYINALRPGAGDYTKQRRNLLKGVSVGQLLKEVRQVQAKRAPGRRSAAGRKRSA